MSGFEFQDSLNWNLVARLDLSAFKVTDEPERFAAIPPQTVTVEKRILMVGCRSKTAKPKWWLGCRASKLLLVSPSSTSEFIAALYTEQIYCPLNVLTLVKFEDIGPYPYLLSLSIPHYMTHLYIEIWAYDGPDNP